MAEAKRTGLTREVLIDAALRLLDEVGLDGLTVRRLATELGVQSPALYWHVRTKQELLDGVADAITRSAGMGPPRAGESWQAWLTRRARAYRRALLAHRDGARIVANAQWLGPSTVRMFDAELAAMVAIGFTPALALHTITTLSSYVTGFVLREQAAPRAGTSATARLKELASVLAEGESAPLLAAIRTGASPVGKEAFEHGLRTLIAGTAAALTG